MSNIRDLNWLNGLSLGNCYSECLFLACVDMTLNTARSKSRKHKRSDEDVEFTTFALARKKLLRQRVELQVDHASERFSASARQTAPDSYDRWLAKIAAGEVISGAAQKNLGLKLKRVDIKHGM